MKIGFSLGRCVRDIVKGAVSIDDVAFVITATNAQDRDHLNNIILMYTAEPEYLLDLDYNQCLAVAYQLWDTNRILQPRAQGLHRHQQPENSIWVDMFPTQCSDNPAVKKAWDAYRFMLHMTENVDTEAIETFK